MPLQPLIDEMIDIGQACHQRSWVPASGGNFSVRIDDAKCLVTRSGVHKGKLTKDDFLRVDLHGQTLDLEKKPSAETLLHCERYRANSAIGAVLHTHSVATTLMPPDYGEVTLAGYELLKIFAGINTHDTSITIPVFANSQDMPALAEAVTAKNPTHAYIIAGHGVYVWGSNLTECYNRLEALEFLLECEWQQHRWK